MGGSHWHARRSFQNIVVFGDSYSKMSESKTWVDHLRRRLLSDTNRPRLYNFAFPGATAEDDLSDQLARFFESVRVSTRTKEDASQTRTPALDPDGTIYCVFLGVNDCGTTECDELDAIVEKIFDALHELYVKAKARNFVLFDVPPIDRSPQAIKSDSTEIIQDRITAWNSSLHAQTTEFGSSSAEATVLLFSPHRVLTDVLDDPLEYDFSEDDASDEGGRIWADDLHLTSEMHDLLAERLLAAVLG